MDDARGDLQVLRGAHGIPQAGDDLHEIFQRQGLGLVVHLQGADAGGEIDHPVELLGFEGLHQRMATKAQHQVQLRRADFQ